MSRKKDNNFMKWWHATKVEFANRVWSSKKRLIKTVAICFVPFLYGFICIAAFWNPIPNIGAAPMALVSQDKSQVAVTYIEDNNNSNAITKFGVAGVESYKTDSSVDGEIHNFDAEQLNEAIATSNSIVVTTFAGQQLTKSDLNTSDKPAMDISVIDDMLKTWETGGVDGIDYNASSKNLSVEVNDEITLSNISYVSGKEADDMATLDKKTSTWKTNDDSYWLQIQIPDDFTKNILGVIETSFFTPSDKTSTPASYVNQLKQSTQPGIYLDDNNYQTTQYFLEAMKKSPINMWSTYKKNFLYGQFMYIFNEFKSALLIDSAPQIVLETLGTIIDEQLNEKLGQFTYKPSETWNYNGTEFIKGKDYILKNDEYRLSLENNATPKEKDILTKTKTFEGELRSNNQSTSPSIIKDFSDTLSHFSSTLSLKLETLIINDIFNNDQLNEYLLHADGTYGGDKYKFDTKSVDTMLTTPIYLGAILEQDSSLLGGKTFPVTIGNKWFNKEQISFKDMLENFENPQNPKLKNKPNFYQFINNVSLMGKYDNGKPVYDSSGIASNEDAILFNQGEHNFMKNFGHNMLSTINLTQGKIYGGIDYMQNSESYFTTNIQGSEYNPYGIGLGQFFLCIGLWVGVLMQTFVYDREKRDKAASSLQWYFSKTAIMLGTGTIQCIILMLTVGMFGWFAIGTAFIYQLIWMLFCTWTFVIIEQALWFAFNDETIGKFCCVLLLIINLSSGWGTFPPFMQFDVFHVLSYIAPYTYSIQGQGAIIYGLSTTGQNWADNSFILQSFGILLIFDVIFLALGVFVSARRNSEFNYGTASKKQIKNAFNSLGYEQYLTKKGKIISHKLPNEIHIDVIQFVRDEYPFDPVFKKYKDYRENGHIRVKKPKPPKKPKVEKIK